MPLAAWLGLVSREILFTGKEQMYYVCSNIRYSFFALPCWSNTSINQPFSVTYKQTSLIKVVLCISYQSIFHNTSISLKQRISVVVWNIIFNDANRWKWIMGVSREFILNVISGRTLLDASTGLLRVSRLSSYSLLVPTHQENS